jgi:hypothetical protein
MVNLSVFHNRARVFTARYGLGKSDTVSSLKG